MGYFTNFQEFYLVILVLVALVLVLASLVLSDKWSCCIPLS